MGKKKRDKRAANEAEKMETMAQAAGAYSAYRPHEQQALNAALQQQLSTLQPLQDVMGMLSGGKLQMPGGQGMGGIVTPEMMGVGATSMAPGIEGAPYSPEQVKGPGIDPQGQAAAKPAGNMVLPQSRQRSSGGRSSSGVAGLPKSAARGAGKAMSQNRRKRK